MSITNFHLMRRGLQVNANPASERDLHLSAELLRETLLEVEVFDEVEVEVTDDVDQLVIAMCRFSDEIAEDQVEWVLGWLWESRLRCRFWEVHGSLVAHGHVEFEGATRPSPTGEFVTVHLVAQRVAVPAQRYPDQVSTLRMVPAGS